MKHFVCAATWAAVLCASHACTSAAEYKLYFLGGQSNMDGYGYARDLPETMRGELPGVRIFGGNPAPDGARDGGLGTWAALQPGYGIGFSSDGTKNSLSDRFGPELTFAHRLRELSPDAKVAIIKYSRGGTSIDPEAPNAKPLGCWEPDYTGGDGDVKGINQFDHFLRTVETALAQKDIDGDGEEDCLVPAGIAWMQGESDAFTEPVAKRYEANLRKVMSRIRQTLVSDDADRAAKLPIVIGRIVDSGKDSDGKTMDFCEIVQEAQAAYVKSDPRSAFIDGTAKYKFSDAWHYDSAAYIDLGQQFADALHKLNAP